MMLYLRPPTMSMWDDDFLISLNDDCQLILMRIVSIFLIVDAAERSNFRSTFIFQHNHLNLELMAKHRTRQKTEARNFHRFCSFNCGNDERSNVDQTSTSIERKNDRSFNWKLYNKFRMRWENCAEFHFEIDVGELRWLRWYNRDSRVEFQGHGD